MPSEMFWRKLGKRTLIVAGVATAGVSSLAALDYALDVKERARYHLAATLGGQIMHTADSLEEAMYTRRQLLRLLKFLSATPETAAMLAAQGPPDALCNMLLLRDPKARSLASHILYNVVKADEGWRNQLIETRKIENYLSPLVKLEEKEYHQRKEAKPHNVRQAVHTQAHVIKLLLNLINSTAQRDEVIKQMGWKSLYILCTHNFSTKNELNMKLQSALANSIVNWTQEEDIRRISKGNGVALLSALAKHEDPRVTEDAARVIANLTLHEGLARVIYRRGALDALDTLVKSLDINTRKQAARAIANLSTHEVIKEGILGKGWIVTMCEWVNSGDDQLQLIGLIGLGNLAASFPISPHVKDATTHREVAAHLKAAADRLVSKAKEEEAKDKEKEDNARALNQLIRAISHLSIDENMAACLFEKFPPSELLELVSLNGQQPLSSVDHKVMRQVAFVVGNMSHQDALSLPMLQEKNWNAIRQMTAYDDQQVQRQLARTIANIAVHARGNMTIAPGIQELITKWRRSSDVSLRSHAIRGDAVLALLGPKYPEGVHLLYPLPQESALVPKAEVGITPATEEAAPPPNAHKYDLVLIHGVTGHPYGTWAVESLDDATAEELSPDSYECWPRDWLPAEIPELRVISIGYEIFLSKWFGTALPLKEQSRIILENLKLAGVGSKPTVFITHSFGGLVVKQLLKYASEQEEYKSILENTKAVVFYSTPHKGVAWTNLAVFPFNNFFFKSTSAVEDLRPDSPQLLELNSEFPDFAPHVSTLSYGETLTCLGGPSFNCYQVVTDESGNPGFDKWPADERFKHVEHRYIRTEYDHLHVHHPTDKEDERYTTTLQFIKRALQQQLQAQQQAQQAQQTQQTQQGGP